MFRKIAPLLSATFLLVAACATEADDASREVRTDEESREAPGEAAVSALRAAPDAVTEAGTAGFEMVMEGTVQGQSFEFTATGAVDGAAEQMSMEMDIGAMLEEMAEAEGEPLPPGFSDPWLMVADGSTMYMQAPIFEMLGVDGWISMTPEDLGSSSEAMGLGPGAYDFTQTLDVLRGVTGEPELVGREEVRGVPTRHFEASMNLAQALEDAPADQREQLETAFEQLGGGDDLGDVDIPVDVWIDGDDLPRRLRMDMGSMFAAAGMGGGDMTMTMEMFDYGEPVEIEVPSPDEVTPYSEALGGFGAADGS